MSRLGAAGPVTAGAMGVTGITCSTCVRRVVGMSASLSKSLAGKNKRFYQISQTKVFHI